MVLDIDDWNEDHNTIMIEFNARELFTDLPSLFRFCKKAIEEEDESNRKKYRELAEDKLEQNDNHAKLRASVSLAKDGIKNMQATIKEGQI